MDKKLLRAQLLMEAADLLAETSMDDLEKQKELFWKNHAARKDVLDARKKVLDDMLRNLNKSSKRNKEDEDENDKKFKEMDDRLNSINW